MLRMTLGGLALLAGCVAPSTTLQTARTADPGQVTGTLGASTPVHGAFVDGTCTPVHGAFVDGTIALLSTGADRLREADAAPLDEAETRDVLRGALAGILFQPALVPEIALRVGAAESIDLGLRLTSSTIKLDGKYAFVRSERWDLALSAGYVYHTGIGPSGVKIIYDVFDSLELASYSRHDVDLAFIASTSPREPVSSYLAARYIASFPDVRLQLPEGATLDGLTRYRTTEPIHVFGPTAGLRIGSEDVALLLELGLMYSLFEPDVLDRPVDLGGIVVTPAVGVDARF